MVARSAMAGRVHLSVAAMLGGLTVWGASSAPLLAAPSEPIAEADTGSGSAIAQNANSQGYTVLHVNVAAGSDTQGSGTQLQPLQTITHALSIAQPNTLILLSEGVYSAGTGETFPLQMRSGVTVQGAAGPNTADVVIQGGDSYVSPTQGVQNVTILGVNNAGLANVTISNPHTSGVGVWIESGSPIIQEAAFFQNGSTGVYIAGSGSPIIRNSYFSENGEAGLIINGPSSAQIQGNIFENTGTGISVAPEATPAIADNDISHNVDGLVIHADAQPVLENNQISRNRRNSILDYSPWPDTLIAAVPETTQPPPPNMAIPTAVTPAATSQLIAVGGIAPSTDEPISMPVPPAEPASTTAIGGINADFDAPDIVPEPSVGPAPDTIAANPLFTGSAAADAEIRPPRASTQSSATVEANTIRPPATPPEQVSNPEPTTIAPPPTTLDPLPTVSDANDIAASSIEDSLEAPETAAAPTENIAINNASSGPETIAAIAEDSVTEASSVTETSSVTEASTLDENIDESSASSSERTDIAIAPDTIAAFDNAPLNTANNDAVINPETNVEVLPPPEDADVDETDRTVETPPAIAAISEPTPVAVPAFSSRETIDLDAVTSVLEDVELAATIPLVATTALFTHADLTPALQVPEAVTTALAEAEASIGDAETSEASIAEDENANEETIAALEPPAETTEDLVTAANPETINAPSEQFVSLTEPSIDLESILRVPSESEDAPEAVELTIVPPPSESVVSPTAESHHTLPDTSEDASSLLPTDETPQATNNVPALPTLTANSSDADIALISVPSVDIPVGAGGELPQLVATDGAAEGPPPPPSRAAALGLAYRVLVEDTDPALQDQISQHVPDAFRVRMNGQSFIQVGAYPTLEEAQAQAEQLNQHGLQAQIEQVF
ncbi:MAG: DUF1565 domain-containing protein [Cyanobacteria bacterium P01_F01_bin.86]